MKSKKEIRFMLSVRRVKIWDVKEGLYMLSVNELEKIKVEIDMLEEILEIKGG